MLTVKGRRFTETPIACRLWEFHFMLISEAIKRFSNWKSFNCKEATNKFYLSALRQFALFTRNCDLENISLEEIVEYFKLMRELGWDENSFIPKAASLRKLLEFFSMQGFNTINPALIPIPHLSYKLPRVAGKEDFEKLLSVIPNNNDPRHIRNRAVIHLFWDTGARNGEICSLNLDDLDLINRRAIIKTEKSQGRRPIREIFWTEETNKHLKTWIAKRDKLNKRIFKNPEALFVSITSNYFGKRFDIKAVGAMLRGYSIKAGMPYMNAHSFRHHMGHQIVEKGGSNSDVSNILGHSDLSSSYIYTLMSNAELQKRHAHFVR